MWKSYNFPVFLLTESGTKILQEVLHSIRVLSCFFIKLETQDTSDGLLKFEIVVRYAKTNFENTVLFFK